MASAVGFPPTILQPCRPASNSATRSKGGRGRDFPAKSDTVYLSAAHPRHLVVKVILRPYRFPALVERREVSHRAAHAHPQLLHCLRALVAVKHVPKEFSGFEQSPALFVTK